jgi:hypothetical protein
MVRIFAFMLFSVLLLASGLYLVVFADWFALGVPLVGMGTLLIGGYLTVRRTLKKSAKSDSTKDSRESF